MKIIRVAKDSSISSLNQALAHLPEEPTTIYIEPGIYYEKVKIVKSNLNIIGVDPTNTIITFDDYAKEIHEDGMEYNTFRTYTMMIIGSNIRIENIQIRNESGHGDDIGQAVALSLLGNHITVSNCHLKGYQDTLFLGPLPVDLIERYQNFLPDNERKNVYPNQMFFFNTTIEGNVDFIFGTADSLFENCEIISNGPGYIVAPATPKEQFKGFTFINCNFSSPISIPHSYLARPWRDYGKATFLYCTYGEHIYEEGFNKWNDSNRDQTCRFSEYHCNYNNGKKANRIYFANQLNDKEAIEYLKRK